MSRVPFISRSLAPYHDPSYRTYHTPFFITICIVSRRCACFSYFIYRFRTVILPIVLLQSAVRSAGRDPSTGRLRSRRGRLESHAAAAIRPDEPLQAEVSTVIEGRYTGLENIRVPLALSYDCIILHDVYTFTPLEKISAKIPFFTQIGVNRLCCRYVALGDFGPRLCYLISRVQLDSIFPSG